MTNIQNFIQEKGYVLMPGGMGTELQRRGYKTKLPLWSATANQDAFDLVSQIHADYLIAGADICVTNTFRTTPRAYEKAGQVHQAREALHLAIEAAKTAQKAVSKTTFVAGSFTTLEDCYMPELVPPDDDLKREHFELVEFLVEEKVDFLLPETINSLREAKVMAQAASQSGLPFFISFVADEEGVLLDGTPLQQVIEETDLPGRFGVSLNCRSIEVMEKSVKVLVDNYTGIKGVYPNGIGKPHDDLGWKFEEDDSSVQKFTNFILDCYESGIKILGGCCGTTPHYTDVLAKEMECKKAA